MRLKALFLGLVIAAVPFAGTATAGANERMSEKNQNGKTSATTNKATSGKTSSKNNNLTSPTAVYTYPYYSYYAVGYDSNHDDDWFYDYYDYDYDYGYYDVDWFDWEEDGLFE